MAVTGGATQASGVSHPEPQAARRFAGDAAWVLVAQGVGKAASFAFVVAVTRNVGVVEYGWFNFAASLVPLFLVFSVWGLDMNVYRAMTAPGADRAEVVASGLAVRLLLGVAALAMAVAIGPLFIDSARALEVLVLVGGALLLDEISAFFGTCMRAIEQTRVFALIIFVNRILSLALVVPVLAAGGDVVAVSATYLLGSASAAIYAAVRVRTEVPDLTAAATRRHRFQRFLREGAPLGLAAGLNMALFRIDAVLLQAIEGPRAVAQYGVAYRFFESFLFIAWSLAVVAMTRLADRSRAAAERAFMVTAALLLTFYLPIAAAAQIAGPEIIRVVFGVRYVAAAPAVLWLTAAGGLYFGFEPYAPSVARASQNARDAGVAARVQFSAFDGVHVPRGPFDLVTINYALHHAGDPVGLLSSARQALAPRAALLIVEFRKSARLEDDIGTIRRLAYGYGLLECLPTALAEGGPGYGTGITEPDVRQLADKAGFREFTRILPDDPMRAFFVLRA